MDYILWTIVVLAGMYVVVRLVFAHLFKKERYNESSDIDPPTDQPRP